jgi:FMN phosphatase YigB (HAD superfamily)
MMGAPEGRQAVAQTAPGSAQYRVKALFFDAFGTLVDWRTGIAQELRRILSHVAMRWTGSRLRTPGRLRVPTWRRTSFS